MPTVFNDETGNPYEMPRNSARGGSINWAADEALLFSQMREAFLGAAMKDREFYEGLGEARNIIVEEAARDYLTKGGEVGEVPENWKERVERIKPVAYARWASRPRG